MWRVFAFEQIALQLPELVASDRAAADHGVVDAALDLAHALECRRRGGIADAEATVRDRVMLVNALVSLLRDHDPAYIRQSVERYHDVRENCAAPRAFSRAPDDTTTSDDDDEEREGDAVCRQTLERWRRALTFEQRHGVLRGTHTVITLGIAPRGRTERVFARWIAAAATTEYMRIEYEPPPVPDGAHEDDKAWQRCARVHADIVRGALQPFAAAFADGGPDAYGAIHVDIAPSRAGAAVRVNVVLRPPRPPQPPAAARVEVLPPPSPRPPAAARVEGLPQPGAAEDALPLPPPPLVTTRAEDSLPDDDTQPPQQLSHNEQAELSSPRSESAAGAPTDDDNNDANE